jgi:ABC-type xylose transport system permease subunit
VPHGDVILALLGASATLSGLLLVFLGFIVGIYGGLSNDGADDAKTKLGRAALGLLIAFIVGLVCVSASTLWLVISQSQPLYDLAASLFALQVAGLTVATIWTMKELLSTYRQRVTRSRATGTPRTDISHHRRSGE